jgi:hypothetical protein
MRLITNQYIGKCLIDETTTHDDVKRMTYEAFQYFWDEVVDHTLLPIDIRSLALTSVNLSVIYVRTGDPFLCEKKDGVVQSAAEYYKHVKNITMQPQIALIGDVDNQSLTDAYRSLYGDNQDIIKIYGNVSHSGGGCRVAVDEWNKIFNDLYLLYHAKHLVILNNFSNFPRIVLFLGNQSEKKIHFLKNDQLSLITDTSTIFSKHYQF